MVSFIIQIPLVSCIIFIYSRSSSKPEIIVVTGIPDGSGSSRPGYYSKARIEAVGKVPSRMVSLIFAEDEFGNLKIDDGLFLHYEKGTDYRVKLLLTASLELKSWYVFVNDKSKY